MTREEAIHIVKTTNDWTELRAALQELVPELAENDDEKMRNTAIGFVKHNTCLDYINGISKNDVVAWLEKQGEQKNVEKHSCKCIHVGCHVNNCKRWCHSYQKEVPYELCNELCERFANEQKLEWSDEDERCVRNILWRLDGNVLGPEYMDRCKRWLESIKDRCIPQKQWKPNKEQLDALQQLRFFGTKIGPSATLAALDDLYDNLKAL